MLGNVVGKLVGLAVVGNAVGTPHNGLSPALQYPCSLQYDEEGDETGWVDGSGDSQSSHPPHPPPVLPHPPLVPVLPHSSRRRNQPLPQKSSYIAGVGLLALLLVHLSPHFLSLHTLSPVG